MNLKSMLLCIVLCAVLSNESLANNPPAQNVKSVIDEFVESNVNTDFNRLSKILDSDAMLKFSRGNELLSQSQPSILKFMKQNNGIKQNCFTTVDIFASSNALVMAKVNFIYDDFTIENILTLELDKTRNWKITRINKFFNETEPLKVLSRR